MTRAPLLIVAGIAAAIPSAPSAQNMEDRARAAADAAQAKTSDSEVLRRNFVTPGMAGQAIATINDAKRFTPNIACQKTATLLEILVQPSAAGDIGTVRIARDKDFDGSLDGSSTLPVPVSGICANGVISCEPGTWDQCRSFRWKIDAAKDLKLAQVDMTELSACYCVNNSCGANLVWGNLPSVLSDLGGGIVGALTTDDPRIGVAEARIDGPAIVYVGAQSTACTSDPALGQTAYRANPTAIQGDAFIASSANSIFQTLAASPVGSGKAEQTPSCTIEREITVRSWDYDDIVVAAGPFAGTKSCGAGCRIYRIQGDGRCGDAPPTFTATFDILRPERLIAARIIGLGTDDWVQGRVNGQIVGSAGKRPWLTEGLPSGDCETDGQWYSKASYDVTAQFRAGHATVGARVRANNSNRWGYVDVEVKVDTACETSERLVDLCAGYASEPQCYLRTEDVDGVQTVRNGVATGLRPVRQTRLFGSVACTLQFSRDFFRRERSYRCVTDSVALPPPDLSRGAYIIDQSTETLLADRVKNPDGSLTSATRTFGLPDRVSVPACESICKTRAPKANTAVAPGGVIGNQQNDPAGWDIFYHVCGAGRVCPLGAGEEVVSACGCLDDFPEAAVMMQTVRLAGADLVCTGQAR